MQRISINGEWLDAVSTASCEIKHPATPAPLGTVPDCGTEEVRRHFDTFACADHVASKEGTDCLRMSCRARRGCPVGAAYRYGSAQSEFHMAAFLAANGAS